MSINFPITATPALTVSNATVINSHAPSPAPPSLAHVTSPAPPKSVNLPETIRQLEQQILFHGPGPHPAQQKEEISKLNTILYQYKVELQKSQSNKGIVSGDNCVVSGAVSGASKMSVIGQSGGSDVRVLDKRRLQELVKEVDPLEQLEDDVEEVLLQIADDFIESVVTNACNLAKHRKSTTLEAKDVQLHLERNWNMWIPGFGAEELRPYKRAFHTEAHKQRMALIKKTLKKY